MNFEEWWRCGCGLTARELSRGADCRCGLNPFAQGSWVRVQVGDRYCWRLVRDLGERSLALTMRGSDGAATEVIGLRVGDLGSLCARWTVEILVSTASDTADAWHAGQPYRYVRRGDERAVPWLAALILGCPVYCVDGVLGVLMIVDAFVFVGGDPSQRVTFLVGRPFSAGRGDA